MDVPVIANGSVFTLQDALNFKERTGVDGTHPNTYLSTNAYIHTYIHMHDPYTLATCRNTFTVPHISLLIHQCDILTHYLFTGVMSARGILQNPALFAGTVPMSHYSQFCFSNHIYIHMSLILFPFACTRTPHTHAHKHTHTHTTLSHI